MSFVADDLLGIGIYSPAEAAFYARIRTKTLKRWLYGDAHGEAVLTPQIGEHPEKVVTFLDFVQALAIREIRLHHQVPLPKIRAAIQQARSRYNVAYPFAYRNTTYLFGNDIVIRLKGEDVTDLTGSAGQRLIKRVAEVYWKDLGFDPDRGGLAKHYRAFLYPAETGSVEIDMDPEIRFGEPVVRSCGYTAQTLWEAYEAEGGIDQVAKNYGVEPSEVEAACRYFDFLQGNAAA